MDTANEDLPDAGTDVPPEPLTAEQRREVYMQAENVFWCWTIFFGAAAVGSSLMSLQILVAVALQRAAPLGGGRAGRGFRGTAPSQSRRGNVAVSRRPAVSGWRA
jgi:hypothetical protein